MYRIINPFFKSNKLFKDEIEIKDFLREEKDLEDYPIHENLDYEWFPRTPCPWERGIVG